MDEGRGGEGRGGAAAAGRRGTGREQRTETDKGAGGEGNVGLKKGRGKEKGKEGGEGPSEGRFVNDGGVLPCGRGNLALLEFRCTRASAKRVRVCSRGTRNVAPQKERSGQLAKKRSYDPRRCARHTDAATNERTRERTCERNSRQSVRREVSPGTRSL